MPASDPKVTPSVAAVRVIVQEAAAVSALPKMPLPVSVLTLRFALVTAAPGVHDTPRTAWLPVSATQIRYLLLVTSSGKVEMPQGRLNITRVVHAVP
jgi:hypothetical protein